MSTLNPEVDPFRAWIKQEQAMIWQQLETWSCEVEG